MKSAALVLTAFLCTLATAAPAQVTDDGRVVTYTAPPAATGIGIAYAHAKPAPMPRVNIPAASRAEAIRTAPDPLMLFGEPKMWPGWVGTGEESPVQLAPPKQLPQQNGRVSYEFGTSERPYTTSRVNAEDDVTVKYPPFRAVGRLFYKNGIESFSCSASLIKRGLVVTAAHCIAEHGKNKLFKDWEFVPAYDNGSAPYGRWTVKTARLMEAYLNGTDDCSSGACPDDIGILSLNSQNGVFAGERTGWFGYGIDGYGFTSRGQVLISQFGYPVALDDAALMERNDAQGSINAAKKDNTIIGSLLTEGASGGPWLVNFGIPPDPSGALGEHVFGTVVGVTSWKAPDDTVKQNGASPFKTDNIQTLIDKACADDPAVCK